MSAWAGDRRRRQESAHVARGVPVLRCELQQRRHRRPLVDEDPDVALRLGDRHGAIQRRRRAGQIAGGMTGERLRDEDVDGAAVPPTGLGRDEESLA